MVSAIIAGQSAGGQPSLYGEVERLANMGIRTIPIRRGSKKPAVRWRGYQRRMPSRRTMRKWCERPDVGGLAMLHGSASSGTACRDYDDVASYESWKAAHPDLAAILPTNVSSRGPKVYFRTDTEVWRKLPDGELIANCRHYTCIPPCVHPVTGLPYVWLVQFLALPPKLDPVEAGFITAAQLEGKKRLKSICKVESGHRHKSSRVEVDARGGKDGGTEEKELECLGEQREEIERLIRDSLPSAYRERNDCLWKLARRLKALPHLETASYEELLPIVQHWWRLALPRIQTKHFGETRQDFIRQWEQVKSPGEGEILIGVKERVRTEAADPLARLKLACETIQARQEGEPFFLSCRTAAGLVGVNKSYAAKLLKQLVTSGVLVVVKPGEFRKGKGKSKAVEYRYQGSSEEKRA